MKNRKLITMKEFNLKFNKTVKFPISITNLRHQAMICNYLHIYPPCILINFAANTDKVKFKKGPFLAHLSRRLIGELIVYRSSRRPCVRPSVRASVHIFKHEYLCNQLADWNEILSEASLGWGKCFSRY